MPPGEFSKRPVQGRQPFDRRMSVDGVTNTPRPLPERPRAGRGRPRLSEPTPVWMPEKPAEPQPNFPSSDTPSAPPDNDDALFQSLDTNTDAPFAAPSATPATPSPAPVPTELTAPEQPAPAAVEPAVQKRSHWLRTALKVFFVVLVTAAFGGGAFAILHMQATHNSPQEIFSNALQSALSTTQLQTDTSDSVNHSTVNLDFTVPTKVTSSSLSTVSINGGAAIIRGYGSVASTYISYQKLPPATSTATAVVAKDAWVQLRQKSVLPPGVSAVLTNAADPRFQAFGPIVFGNFPTKTQNQLLNFANNHHVYDFDPKKVTRITREGKTLLVFPVKLNTSELEILNESAGGSEGLNSGDVQAAVSFIESLKTATVTMYVAASSRQFTGVDIEQGGQTTSFRYSNFDHATVADEPQTKLTWAQFASTQLQIEAQSAAKLTPTQVDALRQGRLSLLHSALQTYFANNNAYPTVTQLSDQAWVQTNLAGVDPDDFYDPLSTTPGLSPAPAANHFAYQPVGSDGKKACDNLTQNCDHYVLTAMLSTGKPYTVKDP